MEKIKEFAIDNVDKLKRLLAGLTAFVLLTPVGAKCESNEEKDTTPKVSQEEWIKEEDRELDVFTFTEELEAAERYLNDRLPNKLDMKSISRIYFTTNIDFIDDDRPFVSSEYADGEDAENGRLQNLDTANSAIYGIQDYNQSIIERLRDLYRLQGYDFSKCDKAELRKYLEKFVNSSDYSFEMTIYDYNSDNPRKMVDVIHDYGCEYYDFLKKCLAEALKDENFDIEVFMKEYIEKAKADIKGKLIRPSVFCHSNHDKEILDQIFEEAFQVLLYYAINKDQVKSVHDIPGYDSMNDKLVLLNSKAGSPNADIATIGAKKIGMDIIDWMIYLFQQEFMRGSYSRAELEKYFDPNLLEQNIWQLKVEIIDPITGLEEIASDNMEMCVVLFNRDDELWHLLLTKFAEKTNGK